MPKSISIQDGMFLLDGKPFFIYSGEVQYFRLKRADWKNVLIKAKNANLNTVASYIPWCWHEREEGIFDFIGKNLAETDLIEFLETIKKLGLYFFARIGPISNAELINEGLPKWLVEKYPQVILRRKDGTISYNPAISSYLHPDYQRFARRWYDNILPIIERYQIKNGGPIVLLQLCNEIGMLNWISKQPDYNKNTTQLYREYLREKYKDIKTLNEIYKKNFYDFSKISQPNSNIKEDNFQIHLDQAYFYRDYLSRYFNMLNTNLKSCNINLPIVANIPQFLDYDLCGRAYQGITTTTMFRDFKKRIKNIIFGGAYQTRRCDFENFHDIVIMNEMIKNISDDEAPKICAEMQFGGWQDRPRIYPKDVELPIKLSIAHGLNGINGYVFAGGRNSKGLAFRGTYNEWQAPVDSKGNLKSHLKPISNAGLFLNTFGSLLEKTKNVYDDISIGFYQPYYATEIANGNFVNELISKRDRFFFDGILRLVTLAGFKFDMFDLEKESLEKLRKRKLIWVFSLDFMDEATQRKLVEYVKSGGNLIISPEIPRYNLSFEKSDIIQREFGITGVRVSDKDIIYLQDKDKDVYVERELITFKIRKGRIIAKTEEGLVCAAIKKVDRGKVLVVGFGIRHIFDYYIETARYLVGLFNIKPAFYSGDSGVHMVLRKNEEFGFLGVFNLDDLEKKISLKMKIPFKDRLISFTDRKIKFARRETRLLPLNTPLGDGEVKIIYSTAEIYHFIRRAKILELGLFSESENYLEIVLSCPIPRSVYFKKKRLSFKYKNGEVKIAGNLKEGFQTLRIIFN